MMEQSPDPLSEPSLMETSRAVTLDPKDLPAFCPNPKMTLWNQHPRVYMDLSVTGAAKCPYCGTDYRLKPGAKVLGH